MCATYREACQRLQLLEDDTHWDHTLGDAIISAPAHQIRSLFAIIVSTCFPSNPHELWHKYNDHMADDFLHRARIATSNQDLEMNDDMHNQALISIEDTCLLICGNSLNNLGMPSPNRLRHEAVNREMDRERGYDQNALSDTVQTSIPMLNNEQKHAYNTVMQSVDRESGGIFFLDAPGGTGKTFLISLILATIRSRGHVAIAVASSGIAATLLEGGRTAHSAFKLPLNMQITSEPTCNIPKNSAMAKVLKNSKIIIWDECTMAHKRAFEALDRTMKDIRDSQNHFGGAIILLAGDFRQILPVIPRSTPADEINACLKSSSFWRYVKTIKLTINMRIAIHNDTSANDFSKQLLDIGNGRIPANPTTGLIRFPENFCKLTQSSNELIGKVFPDIVQNLKYLNWLSERAILAATNKNVDEINNEIQDLIPGQIREYKSFDTVTNPEDIVNYPTEFLNSLDITGLPKHDLKLKVGSVIILLRNICQPKLCNGTRLSVTKMMNNLIQAVIITGKFKGEEVLIPRIPMAPNDLPFDFKRTQFPVRMAFAMTINKAQGQSLSVCGIDLQSPVFAHGQLYVACSRVGGPSSLYIHAPDNQTKNIVYRSVLN